MKIVEIIKAYWNYLIKPKNKELQEKRLEICTPCEFNSTKDKIKFHSHCLSCSCFLLPKSNGLKAKCPKKKWKN